MLRAEDKLRQALEPAHIQLLSQISKLQGGVKDIVDMRNDLLVRYKRGRVKMMLGNNASCLTFVLTHLLHT